MSRLISPVWANIAFALLFPLLMLVVVGTQHAGEVCERVMGGSNATAIFWYEIPCSGDIRAHTTFWGHLWGYLGMFVITGMYSGITFPVLGAVTGTLAEKFAPNIAWLVDWGVTAFLVLVPVAVLLIAFA